MSLPHAILGLLAEQPLTGYEIKTVWFDRTIAHFWAADQPHIYRTLENLAERAWVTVAVELQPDRPLRKVYHLTDAGRAELLRWLRTPQASAPVRDALQVQLFCGAALSNAELTKLLTIERETQLRRAVSYQARLAAVDAVPTLSRAAQLRRLTLLRGVQRAEATLAWLDEALAAVAALPEDPGAD